MALTSGYNIFQACVAEKLLKEDSIDWLAQDMQELHGEGLIARGPVNANAVEPVVWDGHWLQSAHDWRVTSKGRADSALFRREQLRANDGQQRSDQPSTSRPVNDRPQHPHHGNHEAQGRKGPKNQLDCCLHLHPLSSLSSSYPYRIT